MKNEKNKFIAGELLIDNLLFDVYLGEHMTIFHRAGNVWIHIPYNKKTNSIAKHTRDNYYNNNAKGF